MPVWIIVAAALAGLLAVIVIVPLRSMQRLKREIHAEFGQKPKKRRALSSAEAYLASLCAAQPLPGTVDDRTWADLDGDAVYERLNACRSAAGDVMLYSALRRFAGQGGPEGGEYKRRQALMALFGEKPALRQKVQYRLSKLGRRGGAGIEVMVFHQGTLTLKRRPLYILAAILPWALLPVCLFNPVAGLALFGAAIALCANLNTIGKLRNDSGFNSVRYLAASMACAGALADTLQKAHPALADELRATTKGLATLRRSIFILSLDTLMEDSLGFDPLAIFLLPLLSYARVAAKLGTYGENAHTLFKLLGEIDLSIAALSWRHSLPVCCRPAFTNNAALGFTGLVHPLIDDAVPNDAMFENDVLLTGSNASGKSTFIKAVAWGCITGQALGSCAAAAFTLRPGPVATSMAVADSVVDGDSYFVAEIKSMARLLRPQGFCYTFIDEILKGTNTVERIAASAAVLKSLHNAGGLCFAATHDIELTAMLDGLFDNYHFRETVTGDGVYFDYRLHRGPSTTRNAILLLGRMGFARQVVEDANRLVDGFEKGGEWEMP